METQMQVTALGDNAGVNAVLTHAAREYVCADQELTIALERGVGPPVLDQLIDLVDQSGKRFVSASCETLSDVRFKARFLLERVDLCAQVREADDPDNDLLRHLLRAMLAP
jgi:hypothetical protein